MHFLVSTFVEQLNLSICDSCAFDIVELRNHVGISTFDAIKNAMWWKISNTSIYISNKRLHIYYLDCDCNFQWLIYKFNSSNFMEKKVKKNKRNAHKRLPYESTLFSLSHSTNVNHKCVTQIWIVDHFTSVRQNNEIGKTHTFSWNWFFICYFGNSEKHFDEKSLHFNLRKKYSR